MAREHWRRGDQVGRGRKRTTTHVAGALVGVEEWHGVMGGGGERPWPEHRCRFPLPPGHRQSTRRIGGGAFGSGPELGGFTHGRAASPSSLNATGNRPWSPAAASQLLLPIIFSKTMVPCCLLQLQFCHLCATQQIVFSTSIRRKQLQFSFTRQSGWFRI